MTITVSLNNVTNLQDTTSAQNTINGNLSAIEAGFQSALNIAGDQMSGTLNMNSNRILNLPTPSTSGEPVTLGYLISLGLV